MPSVIDWMKKKIGLGKYKFKGFKPGLVYTYAYDPKYKASLDFYDTQPLIIFLEKAKGGWFALNIHFLPQKMRDKIFKTMNYKLQNEKQVRLIMWKNLAIIKKVQHKLIRRYLVSHTKSKILPIPVDNWDDVKNFPTEKFFGRTSDEIFKIVLSS